VLSNTVEPSNACDDEFGGRNVNIGLGQWIQHGHGRNTNVKAVLVHLPNKGPNADNACTSVVMFQALHYIEQGHELFMNHAACVPLHTQPPSWVQCGSSSELYHGLKNVLDHGELYAFSTTYSMLWCKAHAQLEQRLPAVNTAALYKVTVEACQIGFNVIDSVFFNGMMQGLFEQHKAPLNFEVFCTKPKVVGIMAVTQTPTISLPSGFYAVVDGKPGSLLRGADFPMNTIFVHELCLEGISVDGKPAVWLFDGVRVTKRAELLLHLLAHELVHAFLQIVPRTKSAEARSHTLHHHDWDFMLIARTVFGHPMIGPASSAASMYVSSDPVVLSTSCIHASMRYLWHTDNPNLCKLKEVELQC
jgi:hypothetical protein